MQEKTQNIIDVVLEKAKEDGRVLCELGIAELRTIGKHFVIKVDGGFLKLKKGECDVVGLTRATIIPERHKDEILSSLESDSETPPEAYPYQKALAEAIEEQREFVDFLKDVPQDLKEIFVFIDESIKKAATDGCKENGEEKVDKNKAADIAAEVVERLKAAFDKSE